MPPRKDDRGRGCPAPKTLPRGAVPPGIAGGSRHPILYYAAVGVVAGIVALVWLVVIDPMITPVLGFPTRVYGAAIAAGVASILTDRVLARRIARSRWDHICRLALAESSCPACGYLLSGALSEPDGCVVCPECGGAWRADRVGPGPGEPAAPPPP